MPRPLRPIDKGLIYHVINRGNQRTAGDADANVRRTRQRKWSRYVHRQPDEDESLAISQSIATDLPYGSESWSKALARKLKLDLTIRPRARPRKQVDKADEAKKTKAKYI